MLEILYLPTAWMLFHVFIHAAWQARVSGDWTINLWLLHPRYELKIEKPLKINEPRGYTPRAIGMLVSRHGFLDGIRRLGRILRRTVERS